jgi:hypothetical protein
LAIPPRQSLLAPRVMRRRRSRTKTSVRGSSPGPKCGTRGRAAPTTVSTSNPDGAFLETDYSNAAWASFRLRRDSKGNPKIEPPVARGVNSRRCSVSLWWLLAHSPCAGTLCGSTPNR